MAGFWAALILGAYLTIPQLVLGTKALRRCRTQDIPDVIRALFGRK